MGTQAVSAVRVQRSRRLFYFGLALIAAAVVFVGFARTYYLKEIFGTPPLPPLVHIHGLLMTAWISLFIAQTGLVEAHRTDLHRRLGVAGALLAAAIVLVGPAVAIEAVRRGHHPPGVNPLIFMAVPLGDIVVFAVLICAAILLRQRPELHKRLMLVATIAILPPGISRWPWPLALHKPLGYFGVADLLLIACVLYDVAKTRRLNPAFLWGGLLLIASHPLRLMLADTTGWMNFAHWITRT